MTSSATLVSITINDRKVLATPAQADSIERMQSAHAGFASIQGYKPSTGWKVSPVKNQRVVAGFKVTTRYQRAIDALKVLTLDDIDTSTWVPSKGAKSFDNAQEQFDFCVNLLIESKGKMFDKEKTIAHQDAHRKAHAANYITLHNSIKVHLVTEKNEEGLMRPVLIDGLPQVNNIIVPYIAISETVTTEGVRKPPTNSGSKVLMDKCIAKAITSCSFKSFSLKDDNFTSFKMGGEEWTTSDFDKAAKILKEMKDEGSI